LFPALYTADTVKNIDNLAINQHNIPSYELMCSAGGAASQFILKKWPHVKNVTIICGAGNNGGDGYVIARLLKLHGLDVKVYAVAPPNTDTAQKARKDFETGANTVLDTNVLELSNLSTDLIVDALLGTGIRAPLHQSVLSIIKMINETKVPVCAIDIPTGIDGNTGAVIDDAVIADATVSFIGLKVGLFIGAALDYVGELILDTLKVPEIVYQAVKPVAHLVTYPKISQHLPKIKNTQHKGNNGRVVVLGGGEAQYSGAVCLSGEAALRSGAGLVSVCVAPKSEVLMARGPAELMCYAVEVPDNISSIMAQADVLVVGPGLSQNAWAQKCFKAALSLNKLTVLDADGLNLLAKNPQERENWILTPHPGEAARLLNQSIEDCEADRLSTAQALQNKYGGTIILKGASTIVLDTNGKVFIVEGKVPALATGGTGDILAGLVGGLWAQGLTASHAAQVAVSVHRESGYLEQTFGPRGMMASDLLLHIRSLLNSSALQDKGQGA